MSDAGDVGVKLAWASDVHLEMATPPAIEDFCRSIDEAGADALLLGGDIGVAPSLGRQLRALRKRLDLPIYFVLGNHDYYHGDVASVHATASLLTREDPQIQWLESAGAVSLSPSTLLVGVGGWGDLGYGNPKSPIELNDFLLIEDLARRPRAVRDAKLRSLAAEAAVLLRRHLDDAVARRPSQVLVLTHVPPFREASWHEGRHSDDDWLPFFACKATGDVLRQVAGENLRTQFTVLCGHTHSPGEADIGVNLHVSTARAAYGRPALARVMDVA